MSAHAILVTAFDRPGHDVGPDEGPGRSRRQHHARRHSPGEPDSGIYFELTVADGRRRVGRRRPAGVHGVERVEETPSSAKIYGKRIIVMGGGAQVGQVAMGAISEADRHNIRGERISIDTIPLVGEKELAAAVRAVVRLPRVKMLVLAGSLMGGEITEGGRRSARERTARHLAEHGRQRSRRRRPGRQRSSAGGRDGGHGGGRHREVRFDAAVEAAVLTNLDFDCS